MRYIAGALLAVPAVIFFGVAIALGSVVLVLVYFAQGRR